ncbi:MAG TPA: hypothetical protein VER12_09055 [Polyangiaceae bacterium]|nr:hypothetical protein [Polyangiaceae bacterium]HYQ28616.1 hypothetical protein [Polyangiaceae bacterium]
MNHSPFALTKRAQRAMLGSWLGSALAFFAVAVPKCPLCAAAYLCLFGLSASSAQAVAELGVPLCVAAIAGSTLATALLVMQRGRRLRARSRSERTCCSTKHC